MKTEKIITKIEPEIKQALTDSIRKGGLGEVNRRLLIRHLRDNFPKAYAKIKHIVEL